jgi:hypothetical protein
MMGDSRKRRRKRRALAEETQRSKGGPEVVADDAKIDDDGKRERERENKFSFCPSFEVSLQKLCKSSGSR